MKKEKFLLIVSIFIVILGIVYFFPKETVNNVLESTKSNIQLKTDQLAIMYETSHGSGQYAKSSSDTFAPTGYTYNASLSKCANGSTISYNSSTKKVSVYATTNDKCYVYFDKDQAISISNVTISNITSTSFAVNATGNTSGSDNTYYFSKDGGSTWQMVSGRGTSAVYIFSGLSTNTSYNVVVKIKKNGVKSANYTYGTVKTSVVSITGVTITGLSSTSFTVNATAKTTGSSNTYYFSKDGGSSFTAVSGKGTGASYTFSGLTTGASYNVVVKVANNGATSANYTYGSVTTPAAGSKPVVNSAYVENDGTLYIDASPASSGAAITTYNWCVYGVYAIDYTREQCGTDTTLPIDTGVTNGTITSIQVKDANGVLSDEWTP